jgi:tRNA A-37 threonylcarbamoyl transferase component Bud32
MVPTIDRQSADDVHWQIAPGWEEMLLGPEGLRLPEWLKTGRAQVVKDGAHRTVYRVDLPGKTVYLKHYRCAKWPSVLRHLVRASASRREWRKTIEVARRRIPTAVPVAWGEMLRGGIVRDNYFVTEEISHSQSVDQFAADVLPRLDPRQQCRCRRDIVLAVARLTAEVHRAGIYHNDFHTGNLLLKFEPEAASGQQPGQPSVFVIDLPGVRITRSLSWRRSRDGLVMLLSGWLNRLSRTERWRFLTTYLAERPELRMDARTAAAEVEAHTRSYARHILCGRDKRTLGINRDFYCVQGKGGAAYAVSELPLEQLETLLAAPDALIQEHRHDAVKLSHSSVVVQATLMLADRTVRVAFKRTRQKSWWKRLASWLRPTRAVDGWYRGHALLQRGIATARPLCAIEPRGGFGGREGYLATQWIDSGLNLHLYGWELAGRTSAQRQRRVRQCAESLGRLLGRMHAWRIGHRDLKACNLMVAERADGVETFLIDLDGLRIASRQSSRSRARDLARLATSIEAHEWVSRTIRLRFLRAYLRELSEPGEDWKALWRAVARHSRAELASRRRRQEPID